MQFRSRFTSLRATLGMLSAVFVVSAGSLAMAQDAPIARTAGDATLQWGPCPDFMPEGCAIAVLQGDPAQDNADVLFRLPGNATAPRHYHTSAERLVLIAGKMEIHFDDHDPVTLTTGAYAYAPARLPHVAKCVSDEDCVLFIAFETPVDALPGRPQD